MNKRKITVISIFLAVVALLIYLSINSFFYVPVGYRIIKESKDTGNSSYISFEYLFKQKTLSRYEVEISDLYTQSLEYAYHLFNNHKNDEKGIYYLNTNPNKKVQIDENLYITLKTICDNDDRNIFLGPIYYEYNNLFMCNSDVEANHYSPLSNQRILNYFNELLIYINNPENIYLNFYENNNVELIISDSYMSYLEDNDVSCYIDLFLYENACTLDYLDKLLIQKGYDNYILSSNDGYVINRNTISSNNINLFDLIDNEVINVCLANIPNTFNAVSLYSFPITEQFLDKYYVFENGDIINPFVSLDNGLNKTSNNNLILYNHNSSLLELCIQARKAIVQEEFDIGLIENTNYIYSKNNIIYRNDPSINLTINQNNYNDLLN